MAVRRLHSDQPSHFAFTPENLAWAATLIAKFPDGKQASAVIPLLWRAQEQNGGWVSEPALRAVADLLGMAYIRVYEIATFYTMFQLSPVGKKAHVQVCGTTPCMLRGSGGLIEVCERRIAHHQHELSGDGNFSWEEVECLGSCANAPLVQIGKDTYEDLTPEQLERILDSYEKGQHVLPGSQTGRKASCPKTGPTTLTDPALYDGTVASEWRKRFPEITGDEPKAASLGAAAVADAGPATPAATPAPHPAALAAMANAGLVSELEKRGSKPLSVDEIERLKGVYAKPAAAASVEKTAGAEPELLKAPNGEADLLTLIWGIGPKLEEQLNALGIWHFSQIAVWTTDNIAWADAKIADLARRANRDKWVEQAKKLMTGWRPESAAGDKPKG